MKTPVLLMLVALVGGLLAGCSTTPASTSPDLHLAAPQSSADREYLGLAPGATNFLLEEIRCEVLVIDCFDMYCHICQAGAGHVNDLYRMTQERGLGSRVKFIGLGLGDTPLEVATYKEKFKVPFPVFPDRKSTVANNSARRDRPICLSCGNKAMSFSSSIAAPACC